MPKEEFLTISLEFIGILKPEFEESKNSISEIAESFISILIKPVLSILRFKFSLSAIKLPFMPALFRLNNPERLEKLLLKNLHHPPLIWYQPGAEDETSINWLEEAGWKVVYNDCIVRFLERNNMVISKIPLPWFRQVIDSDESGCSIWTVHEFGESSDLPVSKVEWVGDLLELEQSNHIIPKYIRGLVNENEDLENCARRLAN